MDDCASVTQPLGVLSWSQLPGEFGLVQEFVGDGEAENFCGPKLKPIPVAERLLIKCPLDILSGKHSIQQHFSVLVDQGEIALPGDASRRGGFEGDRDCCIG